jgi:hypothetical protein
MGHPASPLEGSNERFDDFVAGHRQVFGLAGAQLFLLAVTSQLTHREPVLTNTAFVPAHRCGTVPDSHRIPSSLAKEN